MLQPHLDDQHFIYWLEMFPNKLRLIDKYKNMLREEALHDTVKDLFKILVDYFFNVRIKVKEKL